MAGGNSWVSSLPKMGDAQDEHDKVQGLFAGQQVLRPGDVAAAIGRGVPPGFELRTDQAPMIARFVRDGRRINYLVNYRDKPKMAPFVMDKVGIDRRLLTAGENKGFLDPFSPQNATHRAYAQQMLDEIHAQFIAIVREGRGDRLKETPELFSGLAWSGQQAVALGLADDFGSLDQVAREVVKAEEIIDYTQHENVASRLAKRFGAGVGESAMLLLQRATPSLR